MRHSLNEILATQMSKITYQIVLVIKDEDGDMAMLWRTKADRIVLQFQDEWSPIVYPLMSYEVIASVTAIDGLRMLSENSKKREDAKGNY